MDTEDLWMGGFFQKEIKKTANYPQLRGEDTNQKYFRPSRLPALNTRVRSFTFFNPYYTKPPEDIQLPSTLTAAPEDTILNYFSVLREAAYFSEGEGGGCGTVGMAAIPYPVAYQFLDKEYQKRVSYEKFFHSFRGIGHITLIKLNKVKTSHYFVELETIEGSAKDVTFFAYYYGFITVIKEKESYKIHDMTFHGEDFLCAPYHGWDHEAEAVVDVKYGEWCKLVKKRYPTYKNNYVKHIYVHGTDGHDYLFVFFELTNGTDVEIAQFKRRANGRWIPIKIDPEKCLKQR
ncbi:hypothetical protein [Bacillus sp. FJAT-27231]|uniref:hypothetical protein n=1 Tax=Bacillus sp. FJAT-27231 TaxID=1679168 RepID=UPI000A5C723E|nr:hypothetical protein [Bacillus sp. FJAT-27231]